MFSNRSYKVALALYLLLFGYAAKADVITHSGTISANTLWSGADIHVITGNVTVATGVTLTIEPGAIIKFHSSRQLTINGRLLADDAVFTAWTDDEHGGDTNGDGPSSGTSGYWNYIYFSGSSSTGSRLSNSLVRYAGGSVASVYIASAQDLELVGNTLEQSANSGIWIENSQPLIEGNTIAGSEDYGIYLYTNGRPVIRGNTITTSGSHGIHAHFTSPQLIEGNTIIDNGGRGISFANNYDMSPPTGNTITGNLLPMRVSFSALPEASGNNILYPNTHNTIEFYGNTLNTDKTLGLEGIDAYYQITNATATVGSGATLTVEPGVVWKFASSARLWVDGRLLADGAVFTAATDDEHGGDTNGDGPSSGTPGYWNYIYFSSSSTGSRLSNSLLRYAGGSVASVYIASAQDLELVRNTLEQSANSGIWIENSQPLIEGNTIAGSEDYGIYLYTNGRPVIRGNTITTSGSHGIHAHFTSPQLIEGNTIIDNGGRGISFANNYDMSPPTGNTITGNLLPMRVSFSALPEASGNNILYPNTHNTIEFYGNTLNADKTLGLEGIDAYYQITNATATVGSGATLTVEPGVVWKFASSARLWVDGRLLADGAVFTAATDDEHGGDTNGDGPSTGTPGYWNYIYFSSSSTGSRLSNSLLRYAGKNTASVYIASAQDLELVGNTLEQSANSGIWIENSQPLIEGNTIAGSEDYGIYLYTNGRPVIRGNTITTSGSHGIHAHFTSPQLIEGNTIIDNGGRGISFANNYDMSPPTGNTITGNLLPMRVSFSALPEASGNNILYPNTHNTIEFYGNTLNADKTLGLEGIDAYYQITNATATVGSGATLTVEPGVVWKFASSARLWVDGRLLADGAVFTAANDDDYGGDSNQDGLSTGTLGYWNYIYFSSSSTGSRLSNSLLRYAGKNTAAVYIASAQDLELVGNTLEQSANSGIWIENSQPLIEGNTIAGSEDYGIYLYTNGRPVIRGNTLSENTHGIYAQHAAPQVIAGNTIVNNSEYGILFDGGYSMSPPTGNTITGNEVPMRVSFSALPSMAENTIHSNTHNRLEFYGNILTTDRTLSSDDTNVYYQLNSTTVGVGATLTVEPGVVWKLGADDQLVVSGRLLADGAVFTAWADDEHGGDSNGDGPSSGTPGYWRRIYFDSGTNDSELKNSTVKSATTGVWVYNSELLLEGNTISGSEDYGIYLYTGGRPVIRGNTLSENTHGIYAEHAAPQVIAGNTIVNNSEYGILFGGGYSMSPPTGNTITGNEVPMRVSFSALPSMAENTIHSNTHNRLEFYGNILTTDRTLSSDDTNVYYQLNSTTVGVGATLTVEPGVVWKLGADDQLVVSGRLLADGAVFTAWADDEHGGDSNGDGPSSGTPGYWRRIYFDSGTNDSELKNSTVKSATTGVWVYNSEPLLEGNTISGSEDYGIYLYTGGRPVIRGNTLSENTHGIYAQHAAPQVIAGNTIVNNSEYGILFGGGYSMPPPTGNTITGNAVPLRVSFSALPSMPENTIHSNTHNRLEFYGNTLTTDRTLSSDDTNVYYQLNSTTVGVGATLTVEPGVVWKLGADDQLVVSGRLLADGAVFTAWADDEHGGDSNGDGPSSGTPGYWRRIYFDSGTNDSELKNSTVKSATTGVWVYNSELLLEGNTISGSEDYGIYLYTGGRPVIRGNTLSENTHGIYAEHAAPQVIAGNTIVNNSEYGILFGSNYSMPPPTGNTITGNAVPLRVSFSALPSMAENTIHSNTHNRLEFYGNSLTTDRTLSADDTNVYYQLSDTTVAADAKLTLESGVVWKFVAGAQLTVSGALAANGTAEANIVFTSYKDDAARGDSNGDSNASIPLNGDWDGVRFNDSSPEGFSKLDYVNIRYAGKANSSALYLYRTDLVVDNSDISNSSTNGIRIYEASPTISNSRIWGNRGDGIFIDRSVSNPLIMFNYISANISDGISIHSSANATVTNNYLFLNRNFGLQNNTGNTINASENWWGDVDGSGPYNATNNPTGNGSEISDNVSFEPFQTTPPIEYAYVNYSAGAPSDIGSLATPVLVQGTVSDEWDSTNQAPDRTMAWNSNEVIVDYSGLDSSKFYKLRTSYFNGDGSGVLQSLTDGAGNLIHGSQLMPTGTPVQYEYRIPQASYSSGDLRLKFVLDNPADAVRVAATEVWLLEDLLRMAPPNYDTVEFTAVEFNDIDGNGGLSLGDEFHFHFADAMDTTLIQNESTDANTKLATENGAIYGTTNQVRWSADEQTVIVTLTAGFNLSGAEVVTPVELQDKFGNPVVGSQPLNLLDSIAPQFIGLEWVDVDNSTNLTLGDQYRFVFNEAMNISAVTDGSTDANTKLRPENNKLYGTLNSVAWEANSRAVVVTVTEGYSIVGDEQVVPSNAVTDVAGNSVTGVQFLQGKDVDPPQLLNVQFDDTDANGVVSLGDRYRFTFNEPMHIAAISDNTDEANINLAPADGKIYGTVNRVTWRNNNTQVVIEITEGFSIVGNELVTPSAQLTDINGNAAINNVTLTLADSVAPEIVLASGSENSPVPATDNYQVIVQFNSTMNIAVEPVIAITGSTGPTPVVNSGGTWSSTVFNNDTFTTPGITLTRDMQGNLQVAISAAEDPFGNSLTAVTGAYQFVIEADPPTITSHPIAPEITTLVTPTVTLAGEREDNTAIWLSDQELVGNGSGPWSATVALTQGQNDLAIYARDVNGHASASVTVRFFVDSIAPLITVVTPADNSYLADADISITLAFVEIGSGLDLPNSTLEITRNGAPFTGSWAVNNSSLVFTPDIQFTEDAYTITAVLQDTVGLQSSTLTASFVLDQTPPPAPLVADVPTMTASNPITISGSKEADAAIWLAEQQVVKHTAATAWSYVATLAEGDNSLVFTARDRADNISLPTTVNVKFDNTPPGPVILSIDGAGDGTTAVLDWSAYDEVANGDDIQHYLVYISATDFTDVTGASVIATLPAGTKTYTAQGLQRDQTYYCAVVAVDVLDKSLTTVSTTTVTISDNTPPAEVSDLSVESFADSLTVRWTAPTDTAGDLAGFRVDFAGDITELTAEVNEYQATGLTLATAYPITVSTVDNAGNTSAGVSVTGVTLLSNPTGLSAEPLSNWVRLNWDAVTPAEYVSQYALYAETTDFNSVAGLTPKLTIAGTTATAGLTGLTNNVTYYIAVTAINIAGGEREAVTTISATPVPDTEGPELSNIQFNSTALTAGRTISASGTISLTASDPAGISLVEFLVDDEPLASSASISSQHSAAWDIVQVADGAHTITINAYDTLNNQSTTAIDVNVALAPPAAPVINNPQTGLLTNSSSISIDGSSEALAAVYIYNNGVEVAGPVTADGSGNFSAQAALNEGVNNITAVAENRSGLGEPGAAIIVTLDTSIPDAPIGITAVAQENGEVRLAWNRVNDGAVVGYDIYRSDAAFTDKAAATKVNNDIITQSGFTDIPLDDATYYYSIVAVNTLGTTSELSTQVSVVVDSTAPRAVEIQYTPQGKVDPTTGRIAAGQVDVQVTVSEPLLATPFMSIAPNNGVPINIALERETDTEYHGSFEITHLTPSGTAFAVFSARDLVGNRGTEIDSGRSIEIDTQGPEVATLTIAPMQPIKNDQANPTNISVTIALTEAVKAGELPSLAYTLSGPGRLETPIDNLVQIADNSWRGHFTLLSDAGLVEPEMLTFVFSAVDELDNIGTRIHAPNHFQVYQGELPPLDFPTGLTATALPGGQVELSWHAVEDAADYQLYRQGPDETELSAIDISAGELEFIDTTSVDGTYLYAVASVRSENGQESLSAPSPAVSVEALSTAPAAPTNLSLQLVNQGILAEWQAVSGDVSYRLYRSSATEIFSVEGLTPILDNINGVQALDGNPVQDATTYVVTAVDTAGNESLPSNSERLIVDLLPVNNIHIVQQELDKPVLSWTHALADGYDIYLGEQQAGFKLNSDSLSVTEFTDSGYAGDERLYTIVPLDSAEMREGPARSILLPALTATLAANSQLQRGVMNELRYELNNSSEQTVSVIKLRVSVAGYDHVSEPFTLAAGENKTVPVIVGGYADLQGVETLTTVIDISPAYGEQIEIIRSTDISVVDAGLVLALSTQEFTRGATGQVQFSLENTSDVAIEIVTAAAANAASNEIRFKLSDADDNTLNVQSYLHAASSANSNIIDINLPSGKKVARIPAGETFVSEWIELNVPGTAPDDITVQLEIDKLHYRLETPEAVTINGVNARRTTAILATPYSAEIISITPQLSFGDEDVLITGRALDSLTQALVAEVPVTLVLSINGFVRKLGVLTDAQGNFSYTFTPLAGEGGIYKVSSIHPDVLDRPEHGQFTISRVTASPRKFTVRIPRNFEQLVPIKVSSSPGTTASNVHLVYNQADQPDGVFPTDVIIDTGNAVNLGSGQTGTINLKITGAANSPDSGSLVLKLRSDESGANDLVVIEVNYEFSDGAPALFFAPDFIETGVVQGGSVTEQLTLENKGFTDLANVQLELLTPSGTLAPAWAYLASAKQQGTIAVGEKKQVDLSFSPDESIPDSIYEFKLRVTSDNAPTADIGVFVSLTQSGIGNVLFKLSDIYTATLDENGEIIQGLSNARIQVQNEQVFSVEQTLFTDSAGEALFSDLPAGSYQFRASADNHQEIGGRFRIKPGITVTEDHFLDYNLITVEWSVTEITIEDSYEIVVNATFETDVPAAVVVADPPAVVLPEMQPGEVFYGEIILTNHGLIRADDLELVLPPDDQYFKYEFMRGVPDVIEAKQRISIPYRIVALQALDPDGAASGAGCFDYASNVVIKWCYICTNGVITCNNSRFNWSRPGEDSCDVGSGGEGIGGFFDANDPNEGGGRDDDSEPVFDVDNDRYYFEQSPSPVYQPIDISAPVLCLPFCIADCCDLFDNKGGQ